MTDDFDQDPGDVVGTEEDEPQPGELQAPDDESDEDEPTPLPDLLKDIRIGAIPDDAF